MLSPLRLIEQHIESIANNTEEAGGLTLLIG